MDRISKPREYIIKKTNFNGFDLVVDERVFIPNPETTLLLQAVELYINNHIPRNRFLIDVGTGSGNLAISLATKYTDWRITGTDLSNEALEVAAANSKTYGLKNLLLLCIDLVDGIVDEPDIIVCNLPWGKPEYMLKSNSIERLSFMPSLAVYPKDGLIGAYLNLCAQVIAKGWHTTIFAEIGRIPISEIEREMPQNYQWIYRAMSADYAVLIIQIV